MLNAIKLLHSCECVTVSWCFCEFTTTHATLADAVKNVLHLFSFKICTQYEDEREIIRM